MRSAPCKSSGARCSRPARRYWADRTDEQILAVSAWVAHAEGARDQAAALMRKAADGEDGSVKHVAMENRLYPMRELLGDLLLEMGQARPALQEYAAALKDDAQPLSRPQRRRDGRAGSR